MTKDQAIDAGILAMELLPRTTASQAKEMIGIVEKYPWERFEMAIRDHARTNDVDLNRLCLPMFREILDRPAAVDPNERLEHERAAAQIRQAQAEAEHREAYERAELTVAAFADMPDDELERLKVRALETLTPDGAAFLAKHSARRSLVIQSLIRKVCVA